MILMIFVWLVLCGLYIIYRYLRESKKHRDSGSIDKLPLSAIKEILIEALIVLILLPFASSALNGIVSFKDHQIESKQREEQAEILDSIAATLLDKNVDTKIIEELAFLKYKEVFKNAEVEAKKATNELINSLKEKKTAFAEIKAHGKEYSEKYLSRWIPTFNFILSDFDIRIAELEKSGNVEDVRKSELKLVYVDERPPHNQSLRRVKLKNENILLLDFNPARVVAGTLASPAYFYIREKLENSDGNLEFAIHLNEKGMTIASGSRRTSQVLEPDNYRSEKGMLVDEGARKYYQVATSKLITDALIFEPDKE